MDSSEPGPGTGAAAAGEVISQAGEVRSSRVESLRALAALGVMIGHVYGSAHRYGPATTSTFGHRVLFGGGFGVYLFFVLSGYLLYWPFARETFAGGPRIRLGRYALNRALRILPLYYAVIVILLLVQEHGGRVSDWWRFGIFAENFSHATFEKVNPLAWSLVVELHFYIALPVLAFLVQRLARSSLRRGAIALLVLGGASYVVRSQSGGASQVLLHFSLLSLFVYFAIGMLLALLRVQWNRRPPRLPAALNHSDVWLLLAAPLWGLVFWRYDWEIFSGFGSALMLGACVLPLRRGPLVSLLGSRPLALLGVASYSLYLWHMPIVNHVAATSWAPHRFLELAAIVVPISIAVAFASYGLIEAPFLRLRRRWVSAGQEPTTQGSPATALVS